VYKEDETQKEDPEETNSDRNSHRPH